MMPLEALLREVPQLTLRDARAFLRDLTRNTPFVAEQVLPLGALRLDGRDPVLLASVGAREATTCLLVFGWPAGAATPIHDHTAWGAYQCVAGALAEERYARLDDGAVADHARLGLRWRRRLAASDRASTLGAYDAGIHRISNPGARPAISIHLYGPRVGAVDGRDYDPRRSFVCDRTV